MDLLTQKSVATSFMEYVALSFGICVVVIIDAGRKFCGVFVEAPQTMHITVYKLSQGNYKGTSAEKYSPPPTKHKLSLVKIEASKFPS